MAHQRLSKDSMCSNCFAWRPQGNGDFGLCARHAPQIFRELTEGEFSPECGWPETFHEEACCEWLPMQAGQGLAT